MSGWTPNGPAVGMPGGGDPYAGEREHHDDCEVHEYCECPCACHDDSYYIDTFYWIGD